MRPQTREQSLQGTCTAGVRGRESEGVVGAVGWNPVGAWLCYFRPWPQATEPAWVGALQVCSNPDRGVTPQCHLVAPKLLQPPPDPGPLSPSPAGATSLRTRPPDGGLCVSSPFPLAVSLPLRLPFYFSFWRGMPPSFQKCPHFPPEPRLP